MKITKEGFDRLIDTLVDLKDNKRPKIIKAIADAREHGDLKENAEYHAAKDRQGIIEAQISDYDGRLNSAEVIDVSKLSGSQAIFGATVKIEDLDSGKKRTYKIVSEFEADIDEGLICDASPVAKSIIGKTVGDEFEVAAPKGIVNFEIIDIKFI